MPRRVIFALYLILTGSSLLIAKDVRVGETSIVTVPPSGQCEPDQTNKADISLFEATRKMTEAANNILLAMYVDCRQDAQFMAGKIKYISTKSVYQSIKGYKDDGTTVAQVCDQMRKDGKSVAAEDVIRVKKDLTKISARKYDGTVMVGVVDETPQACYIALVQRFALQDKTSIVQLSMYAVLKVKGQLVFYYSFTPYKDDQSVQSALASHKANVAAFLAMNNG